MKLLLFGTLFLFIGTGVFAQNQIQRAKYWFNNQYSGAVLENLVPAANLNFTRSFATDHLPNGLHTFHLRFGDTEEKWSSTLSSFFYKVADAEISDNAIEGGEYWFNNGHGNAIPLTLNSGSLVSLSTSLGTDELPAGLHTFHLRFLDAHAQWTSTLSSFFYKLPQKQIVDSKLSEVQFWFNNQYAEATNLAIDEQATLKYITQIETGDLAQGLHTFHIRFRSQQGEWSSVYSQFFYKIPPSITSENAITQYQYWLNNSYDQSVTVTSNEQEVIMLDTSVDLSAIASGLHTFHIRFADRRGLWSSVQSAFIYKPVVPDYSDNLITAYRYWFDDAVDDLVLVELDQAINPLDLVAQLDMIKIPAGDYIIHFQFFDLNGHWSSVSSEAFTKTPLPYADFAVDRFELCGQGAIEFTNLSIDADTWHWDFGDGNTLEEFEAPYYYENAGEYTVTLTATDSQTGLDSKSVAVVKVYSEFEYIEFYDICEGESITWQGNEYNTPGEYYNYLQSVNGCDSVYVLNLGGNSSYEVQESHAICEGELFTWQGNEYDAQGSYPITMNTIYGCDSVHVLNLAVNKVYEFEENYRICKGEVFSWQGNEYSQEGIYHVTHQTMQGCDSIFRLNLAVNANYEMYDNQEICAGESYYWLGAEYFEAGTYQNLLATQDGCDSLLILELSVFTINNSVSLDGVVLTAQADSAGYQWVNCLDDSEITGATNKSFTPVENGSYAVWIEQGNCAVLSDCFDVTITFVDDPYFSKGVLLFPNPARDEINLLFEKEMANYSITIWGISGQKIYHIDGLSGRDHSLSLTGLNPGVYLLEIEKQGYSRRIKLLKE